jgi:DNA-binding transcriptional ArsR family regulator
MKKKNKKSPPFFRVWHELIDSKAWKELSCHARAVYIEIGRKYNGGNNGNLSYTYREARNLMHKSTFTKALRELVNHGLIDIIRSGGLYRKCNIFGLSDRWKLYGQENFKLGKSKVLDKNF